MQTHGSKRTLLKGHDFLTLCDAKLLNQQNSKNYIQVGSITTNMYTNKKCCENVVVCVCVLTT